MYFLFSRGTLIFRTNRDSVFRFFQLKIFSATGESSSIVYLCCYAERETRSAATVFFCQFNMDMYGWLIDLVSYFMLIHCDFFSADYWTHPLRLCLMQLCSFLTFSPHYSLVNFPTLLRLVGIVVTVREMFWSSFSAEFSLEFTVDWLIAWLSWVFNSFLFLLWLRFFEDILSFYRQFWIFVQCSIAWRGKSEGKGMSGPPGKNDFLRQFPCWCFFFCFRYQVWMYIA